MDGSLIAVANGSSVALVVITSCPGLNSQQFLLPHDFPLCDI